MRTKLECKYHYHKKRYNKNGPSTLSSLQREAILKTYINGKSANQTAVAHNVSKPTVLRIAKKAGANRTYEKGQGTKYYLGFDYIAKTPFHRMIMSTLKYKNFRKRMFARDKYTCLDCGYRGSKIQLDHILPRIAYPELTMIESNVRTLCIECHKKH